MVAAAALTLVVKAFVVQVYRIPSASMENTLQIGDRVLVNKLVYHFRGIARGDIVVFSGQDSWGPDASPPSGDPVVRVFDDVLSDIGLRSSQTYYIKRVIGLPGDHVACCTDGKITVNGVPLSESSYIYPGNAPSTLGFSAIVPAGDVWVMGDHRGDSDDSRYHSGSPGGGAVPEDEVVGRAFLIIWPPSQFRRPAHPATFGQAALHAGAAGAPVLSVSGAAVTRRRSRAERRGGCPRGGYRGRRRPDRRPLAPRASPPAPPGRPPVRSGGPGKGQAPTGPGTRCSCGRWPAMGYPGFYLRRDLSRPELMVVASGPVSCRLIVC